MEASKELAMCEAFKAGTPITKLQIEYELNSYQAAHRILKKHGLTRTDGGKSKEVAERKAKATEVGATIQDRQGCTKEQWDLLRALDEDYKKTPLAAFNTFKNNFQNLNKEVEFKISLWEWWELWNESGRYAQRVRNPDGMWVMAQKDRTLPLTKDNARIIPFGQLLKETRKPKVVAANDDVTQEVA
jgi:hypothetical protein